VGLILFAIARCDKPSTAAETTDLEERPKGSADANPLAVKWFSTQRRHIRWENFLVITSSPPEAKSAIGQDWTAGDVSMRGAVERCRG
jgi:hypothetical protein